MSSKKAKAIPATKRATEPGSFETIVNPGQRAMRNYFYAGAALSFLISILLYFRTMAVSASFWDSGEFVAAAYTLGVPHSPGTPLYVLVARVFTLLPIPLSIAQKVNLLSALCGGLGVLFLYVLVVKFLDHVSGKSASVSDALIRIVGGLVGALFIAFSSTYWTNAIEAEVYAMSCFLMGFMTWLGLKWVENPAGPKATALIYLLFYLLAMSVGFHLGTILAFSGIFVLVWLTKNKTFSNWEFLVACLGVAIFVADATLYRNGQATIVMLAILVALIGWLYYKKSPFAAICAGLFVLGLSVHLYLFIRSAQNPTIDMGDPESWRRFYYVLRREQYPLIKPFVRKASFAFQLQHFNNYYQSQFEMFSTYLAKLNMGSILPIGIGIWGMIDHFTKHKKSFIMLFATFVVTSLGLIIFLNFSAEEPRDRDYFYSPAFYYFAVFIGIGATNLMTGARNAIQKLGRVSVPASCCFCVVVLALPFFTAKHHFFTHDRSKNYICEDYSKNMLVGLKENAIVFTNGDNDTYPLWYIQEVENYRKDVRVVNLSLLNTPWYIKQVRDNEPKVPITWTDYEVDSLRHIQTKDGVFYIKDLVVLNILRANKWRRPVYFAVTVPPDSFERYSDHLEMQGLAYELVPKKGTNMINEELLEENIYNRFNYRSLLTADWKRDYSVYRPAHTSNILQNYARSFILLGNVQQDRPKKGLRSFQIANEISPDLEAVVQMLGRLHFMAGDTQEALDHYQSMIRKYPDNIALHYRLAEIYERMGEIEKAIDSLDRYLEKDPNSRQAVLAAYGLSVRANQLQRARGYLVRYLAIHPDDEEVTQRLREFDEAVRVRR